MGTFDDGPAKDGLQNQAANDETPPSDSGTLIDGPAKDGLQNQAANDETLPSNSGTLIAGSSFGDDHLANVVADNDLLSAIMPVSWDAVHSVGDDILATATAVSGDGLDSIGHTLDQLTSATNLFDVPPFDLDSPTGS